MKWVKWFSLNKFPLSKFKLWTLQLLLQRKETLLLHSTSTLYVVLSELSTKDRKLLRFLTGVYKAESKVKLCNIIFVTNKDKTSVLSVCSSSNLLGRKTNTSSFISITYLWPVIHKNWSINWAHLQVGKKENTFKSDITVLLSGIL